MGTRSLTFVHEEDGPAIICIYQQFDGYFGGVGDDLLSYLKGTEIVNGIGGGDTSKQFNGAGDLACRIVTHIKGGDEDNIGGAYIMAPTLSDDGAGAEYAYHIYCTVGEEPRLVAIDVTTGFLIDGLVSEIVWPTTDDDGEYIVSQPTVDTSGPLTDDLRRALFAMFVRVFGKSDDEARLVFTQRVLDTVGRTSWSPVSDYAITVDQATRLLWALDAIEQTQQA